MPDPTLLMLLDEVRGKTLRLLQGLTEEQARWTPPGLRNRILWHAAHVYVVVESLTFEPALHVTGVKPVLPAGWFEMFSWESRPGAASGERWPALAQVVPQLQAQQPRLRSFIAGLTEEQLAGPCAPDWDEKRRPVRHWILHGLHDEANHQGEMWLQRKMQGLR